MKRPILLTAIAVALPLLGVGVDTAYAGARVEHELTRLAARQTHGWTQDRLPLDQLEARILRGERIYVTCGTISRLAVLRLRRLGARARVVGAITLDQPNGYDDGHILVEVRAGRRWEVYDLDNNRKPIDDNDRGMTIKQLVAARKPRWHVIARDRKVSWAGTRWRELTEPTYASEAGLRRWYAHVLGIAVMYSSADPDAAKYISEPPARAAQARRIGGYINLPAAQWAALYV
jgi:hypothetical protein